MVLVDCAASAQLVQCWMAHAFGREIAMGAAGAVTCHVVVDAVRDRSTCPRFVPDLGPLPRPLERPRLAGWADWAGMLP